MNQEEIYQRILSKILNFLAYRARTKKEIEQRLAKYFKSVKNVDEATQGQISQKVVDYLVDSRLIDDTEFAKLYIESKASGRGALGKRAIVNKLITKGVNRERAEESVDRMMSEVDELKSAAALLEKKFKVKQSGPDQVAKMGKYLLGRGFSYQVAKAAIDYWLNRP